MMGSSMAAPRERRSMSSVRRILVVLGTIAALTALAPSVSASSHKNFHLDKTCESQILCTIVKSNFKPFTKGTQVTYTFDSSDPWDLLAFPTIVVRHGSTTGVCDWNQPGTDGVLAICTFSRGTGRLAGFHLSVKVTVTGDPNLAKSVWHWDGTYWFGHRHGHHGGGGDD